MKRILALILLLLVFSVLSACNFQGNRIENSDGVMNSGTAIYKCDGNLYYLSGNYRGYQIMVQDSDGNTEVAAEPELYAPSLYVCGDILYYTQNNGENIKIFSKSLISGETEELFSVDKWVTSNEYIYTESNNKIYYFSDHNGLWVYSGGSAEKLFDANACTIAGRYIYYSNDEGLFRANLSGRDSELLLSKKVIFEKNPESRILRVVGGADSSCIDNIVCYDGEIYFLVMEILKGGYGGVFRFNPETDEVVQMMGENVAKRFFIENDMIYFNGYCTADDIRGLFKSDFDGNAERVDDRSQPLFYVNDGVYFYPYISPKIDEAEEPLKLEVR